MLNNLSTTTNVTASSMVDDEVVVSMRATVTSDGTWTINKSIRNSEMYLANQEQCDSDYDEFESKVIALAK